MEPGASGGTEQKFSTRPSSGGRSGAIAISWRAGSRGSGSPVPGTPPTLALHRLGRGGGGPRRFPVASSMLRPLWRLLKAELERRWRPQEGAFGDEQAEGLQPAVGLETAADRRGRMWRNASVCFCAAENCWAKSSTASPNRPAWEIGESRKRCLSDSLISAKVSHRWRSWTTNVDIVWPRARAVTFVALSARSVAVRSSCNTPGSASPSCSCFNALAWWTCRRAMACRAGAACPAAP